MHKNVDDFAKLPQKKGRGIATKKKRWEKMRTNKINTEDEYRNQMKEKPKTIPFFPRSYWIIREKKARQKVSAFLLL